MPRRLTAPELTRELNSNWRLKTLLEYRFSEIDPPEGDSRILEGTVMLYGDVAVVDGRRERFMSGAFEYSDVILNKQHERVSPLARTGPGGLELIDGETEFRMRAELPETREASDALELVRKRVLRGLSVEFRAIEEHVEAGVRVITRAILSGIGLVDRPAYPQSLAEARRRYGYIGRVSGYIPKGTKVDCRCKDGCDSAVIEDAEFSETVIGVRGNYGEALGSTRRGTLRINPRKDGSGWDVEQDLPDTQQARDLMASSKSTDIYARPFMDAEKSDVVVEGKTATYKKGVVRAIVFETTDQSKGWEPVKFEAAKKATEGRSRRIPFWL